MIPEVRNIHNQMLPASEPTFTVGLVGRTFLAEALANEVHGGVL